jgi:NAD(P)-dependent dehydrogenase (short-subunit alcohol dehydrogenase family)
VTASDAVVDPLGQLWPETQGRAPARGRMEGRRIVVVGAGQRAIVDDDPPVGNGRAIALLCAREGAHVACVDISQEAAEATRAAIEAEGGRAFVEVGDVADGEQLAPLLDRCTERLGGLDGLVLVVGVSQATRFHRLTLEQWDREHAINVRSNMLLAQRALETMDEGGSIVLMSSLAALRNASRNPSYETTKAAQVALARSIAVAGQPRGIRCNSVLPGLMDTPMGRDASRRQTGRLAAPLPFGRQGTGWEVAYATLFLLSHESTYVNAHALVVDGGLHVGAARQPSAPPGP